MEKKTGILLVNLGTPDSPKNSDVYRYLIEFLTDARVIDTSWLYRQLLVRGFVVPTRHRQSARAYQQIWTEEGSPLKVYGYRIQKALQQRLGDRFHVELAMRYRHPSIEEALHRLMQSSVQRLIILPLFPHYASATTGSVHQKIMEIMSQWQVVPETKFISRYETHPGLINAFCAVAAPYKLDEYDHILLSFHGLPRRHLLPSDKKNCYSTQCYATAEALVKALKLPSDRYSISFQSRLGREPWIEPYTSDVIHALAKQGKKRVLVFCPAFVSDCLETIYEISIEYGAEFKRAGGEHLELVPGLNDHPAWIDALVDIVHEH